MVANPDRVLIFDTTLRDGEQSPGCSMTRPRSCAWRARSPSSAWTSSRPASRPPRAETSRASQAVAREVQGPIICGLARCNPDDIELAARALDGAAAPPHPRVPRHQRHPPPVQAQHGAGGDPAPGRRAGSRARASCARTWSSPPRTPRAPSSSSWRRWSRPPSPPAPPRSTSPTRSATRCRMSSPSCSATCARTCAASRACASRCTATMTWAWRSPTA